MKQKTLTSLSVATALGLLTPLPSYAFGLGQITLHSALNEPFRAEISVNALRDDERGNLEVRLASTQDFERAGLDRNFLLTQLKFEVVEQANSTRIMVTSDVPIKEPFLGFLLAATTGQGKLLREYTVLLDPPKELYRDRVSSASPRTTVAPQTPATTSNSSRSQPAAWSSSRDVTSEYKVQSRETLWSIAERMRPSADITMQQMMIALLNANPGAFQQNNVNSLYAGSTLRIPSTDEITRLSANAAKTAVDQQNAAWRNRNRSQQAASPSAVTPATSPAENNEVPAETNAEVAKSETTDTDVPTTTDEQVSADETARLKLIAATEDNLLDADPEINGDPDLQRISEQLTLAQETMEAQSQENIDFKNRMDALERQLDTMRRLISLKDADLARLQNLLEQDDSQMDLAALVSEANAIIDSGSTNTDADEWEPVPLDELDLPASNDETSEIMAANETVSPDTEPSVDANDLEQNDPPENAEADDAAVLDSASSDVDAAIDETAQMLDLDQQQMDSLFHRVQAFVMAHKVESLLAILLLLLLVWMVIRRSQREVNWDDAVRKINKTKPAKQAPEMGSVATVTPAVTESATAVESKTKSVDELVEQADMFVGYADYVQAGSALQQAHQQVPEDKDIAAKLMFVYYKQQKSADFIALLNTSGINESDPQWPEIRAWGHQLLPHNPLFAETTESSAEEETVDDFAEQDDTEISIDEDFAAEDDIETPEAEDSDHIEFNLDDYQVDSTKPSPAEEAYERDEEDLLPFDNSYSSVEKNTDIETEEAQNEAFIKDDGLRIDLTQDNVLQPDSSAPEILDLTIDELDNEADLIATEEPEQNLSLEDHDSDELELPAFEAETQASTDTDDVIEDYLNLDSGIDDEELDFDLSDFDSIDEAETKLELAAAYSDMGDPEGARGILEEVLEQGTDDQKKRAQELLDSLS